VTLCGYRIMWVIAMFDLPVDTKAARKAYAGFRKALLKDGFRRMQFSVYARFCASREAAEAHIARVEAALPDDGEIRLLVITDAQFGRMRVYFGRMRQSIEKPPKQLEFF
jgi:CRISPR-associated protein Cas2